MQSFAVASQRQGDFFQVDVPVTGSAARYETVEAAAGQVGVGSGGDDLFKKDDTRNAYVPTDPEVFAGACPDLSGTRMGI